MKIKKDNGFTVVDVLIAVIAIMIFSTLIYSLMYTYVLENVKLKKETLAMIYMTEIFENVAITSYGDLPVGNIAISGSSSIPKGGLWELLPEEIDPNKFGVELSVASIDETKDILKKVELKLVYLAGDKQYIRSMERMKIKE